jgi:hypothetical protein
VRGKGILNSPTGQYGNHDDEGVGGTMEIDLGQLEISLVYAGKSTFNFGAHIAGAI